LAPGRCLDRSAPIGSQISGAAQERAGGVDAAQAVASRSELEVLLLDEEPAQIVVDLSSVAYVDTYALSALVDLAKRCRLKDCRLALVCSEGRMRRALAATSLDEFVATHATLDEALGQDWAP
jgi:anti-anti-sigma factor